MRQLDEAPCIYELVLSSPIRSQNGHTINMTSNTTNHICRRTCKEEEPPFPLLTLFRQLFQIQKLAERHTPQGQHVLMQESHLSILGRPRFKARRIPRRSSKVAIMQPVNHVRRLQQSTIRELFAWPLCDFLPLLWTCRAVRRREASPHE
jgi:hypothetical protein